MVEAKMKEKLQQRKYAAYEDPPQTVRSGLRLIPPARAAAATALAPLEPAVVLIGADIRTGHLPGISS